MSKIPKTLVTTMGCFARYKKPYEAQKGEAMITLHPRILGQ